MDESLLLGLYTADGMRKVDGTAIQGIGIPGGHLMERAGLAVATRDPRALRARGGRGRSPARATTAATASSSRASSSTPASRSPSSCSRRPRSTRATRSSTSTSSRRSGVDVRPATGEGGALGRGRHDAHRRWPTWSSTPSSAPASPAPPRATAAAAIELINEAPGAVVSVDIASGVGASTGAVHGPAVVADLTVALHAAKVGHFVTPGGALQRRGRGRAHRHPAAVRPRRRRLAAHRARR